MKEDRLEYLYTKLSYVNAAIGTKVQRDKYSSIFTKIDENTWLCKGSRYTNMFMTGISRYVIEKPSEYQLGVDISYGRSVKIPESVNVMVTTPKYSHSAIKSVIDKMIQESSSSLEKDYHLYWDTSLKINTTNGIPNEEYKEKDMMTREQAELLAANAAKALQEVKDIEDLFGKDSDFDNGDVILVDLKFYKRSYFTSKREFKNQTTYSYAIIKAANKYYTTAYRNDMVFETYDQLVAWLNTKYIVKMSVVTASRDFIKKDSKVV